MIPPWNNGRSTGKIGFSYFFKSAQSLWKIAVFSPTNSHEQHVSMQNVAKRLKNVIKLLLFLAIQHDEQQCVASMCSDKLV